VGGRKGAGWPGGGRKNGEGDSLKKKKKKTRLT
jgi:hypothetical protein